jgi:inositol transport system ATP-binding protein
MISQDSNDFVLRMEGISKSFSGSPVLNSVDLNVVRGEAHALMGENGAGKSTLMKILSGIYQKDEGRIFLNGKQVNIKSAKEALALGISMIHQELTPVPEMTVSENIFLGKEPSFPIMWIVDRKKQRELALSLFRQMDISIKSDTRMRDLSVAEMQLVEIAKAVSYNSRIIIMDEPTSAITAVEVAKLFEIIRNLKSKGITVIYISHKMEEVFQIADSITVLRDGQCIETRPAEEFDQDTLVKLMVGRTINEMFPKVNSKKGSVALEAEYLTSKEKFRDVSFSVRKGEILGFAGLLGAGRSEVMEAIFGLRRLDSGKIKVNGKELHVQTPEDAVRNRIAFVTDDRQLKGLNLKASVKDNITLAKLESFTRLKQIIRRREENSAADEAIERLRIKIRHREQIVGTLSGGNQQKVVLAKWLLYDPEIIILDEPTRGIDIGAKAEIYKIISGLSEDGKIIIIVSSELQEIIGMCDRVIVMYHGTISGMFDRSEFDQEKIINAAMGHGGLNAN